MRNFLFFCLCSISDSQVSQFMLWARCHWAAVFTQLATAERVAGAQDHQSILSAWARPTTKARHDADMMREALHDEWSRLLPAKGVTGYILKMTTAETFQYWLQLLGDVESHYIYQAYFDGRKRWRSRLLLEANIKLDVILELMSGITA